MLPTSPENDGNGAVPYYQATEKGREVAFYRAGYDGEVALVDREGGRLLAGLRERGLYRSATLVFAPTTARASARTTTGSIAASV